MKTRSESSEVFYPDESPVFVASSDLDYLKSLAPGAARRRARLCAHANRDDTLQEMFIVLCRDSYIRPHKHVGKVESFCVLEGEVVVFLFEDDGSIKRVIQMGSPGSGKPFYYRLSDPVFHTLLIASPQLVFLEITQGPFRREQTVFADWSPDEADKTASAAFLGGLAARHGAGGQTE